MSLKEIYTAFESLKSNPQIKTEVIGISVLGHEILSFTVGNNPSKVVIVEGGLHAREHITTFLCIELIKFYAQIKIDFEICFVPLANPDGVGLCLEGKNFLKHNKKLFSGLVKANKNSEDFSLWKANINCVDLNQNFDALWSYGKHNSFTLGSQNYVGGFPESEPEVIALKNLAASKKPFMSFCFHSKGEVVYYGLELIEKQNKKRDLSIAKHLQKVSGYKPIKTKESVGGFSDWMSIKFNCPVFTVEVGSDKLKHPILIKELPQIFNQTKHMILVGVSAYDKFLKNKK